MFSRYTFWVNLIAMLFAATAALADVSPPPRKPSLYLVIDKYSLDKKQRKKVLDALLRYKGGRGKKAPKLYVVVPEAQNPIELSPRYKDRKKALARLLEPPPASTYSRDLYVLLGRALYDWPSNDKARHQILALTASSVRYDYFKSTLQRAARRGFTVSLALFSGKTSKTDRKQLAQKGIGRVYYGARTKLAVAREARWRKLGKKMAKRIKDTASPLTMGMLGVIGKSSATSRPVVGGRYLGGLIGGTKRYVAAVPGLERPESVIGKGVAVAFKGVRCSSLCDVASVRRSLRTGAKPLVACLDRVVSKLSLPQELSFASPGVTPAGVCLSAWLKSFRQVPHATLIVGEPGAVR
jgi:hypothetical protein